MGLEKGYLAHLNHEIVGLSDNSDLNLFEQCVVAESFNREVHLSTPTVEAGAQLVSQPPSAWWTILAVHCRWSRELQHTMQNLRYRDA